LSVIFSKCHTTKNENIKIEPHQADSVIIHKAPNQEAIDSIKLLKTQQKIKKEKGDN